MSRTAIVCVQVGLMRRGRYLKGKKVGKGNIINNVSLHA